MYYEYEYVVYGFEFASVNDQSNYIGDRWRWLIDCIHRE